MEPTGWFVWREKDEEEKEGSMGARGLREGPVPGHHPHQTRAEFWSETDSPERGPQRPPRVSSSAGRFKMALVASSSECVCGPCRTDRAAQPERRATEQAPSGKGKRSINRERTTARGWGAAEKGCRSCWFTGSLSSGASGDVPHGLGQAVAVLRDGREEQQ
ncbi:hypothetical protein CB1_001428021 [Camelus ferus]|nr:hypothetical protein CB1_001428021 [Camelus ferus]